MRPLVLAGLVGLGLAACGQPAGKAEDRHEAPATPASKLTLTITVVGSGSGPTTSTWTDAAFAAVPRIVGKATDGEARDTWSLRELVHKHVGPSARVVAVHNATGATTLDEAAWNDAARIPILHTTKRGALKFRWADPAGVWGDTILKDVTALDVVR